VEKQCLNYLFYKGTDFTCCPVSKL